jgi:hypothetical protein
MLDFSMYQSGIDFKCAYSNLSLKPLTPQIGLSQSLFWRSIGSRNLLIYLIGHMSSAIDLYEVGTPSPAHLLRR